MPQVRCANALFFVVGLVFVYALSGVVLLFRDIDFLVCDVQVKRKLPASSASWRYPRFGYIGRGRICFAAVFALQQPESS